MKVFSFSHRGMFPTTTVGFTCGSFDVMHAGHDIMLAEAKRMCDHLVVGLQTDPTIDRPESKNKPIQHISERFIQLSMNEHVDEIIVYATEQELLNLLKILPYSLRFLGADWKGREYTGHDVKPASHVFLSREHDWSSSSLRSRVWNEVQKQFGLSEKDSSSSK